MFWEKIGNSVSDRLFRVSVRDSVIAENQCLYISIERFYRYVIQVGYNTTWVCVVFVLV